MSKPFLDADVLCYLGDIDKDEIKAHNLADRYCLVADKDAPNGAKVFAYRDDNWIEESPGGNLGKIIEIAKTTHLSRRVTAEKPV